MKKMNKLTVAALALVAIGFASNSASAQIVANANDLILGFEQAGTPSDLEVDLGAYNTFTTTANLTFSSAYVNATDLVNTFGSSWASTVQWSVAGELTTNNGFDATSTQSAVKGSSGTQSGPAGLIASLYSGVSGATPTTTNGFATVVGNSTTPASTISDSYTYLITNGGSTLNYGAGSTEKLALEQTGAGSLALYNLPTGTGAALKLGTFTLSSGGALSFVGATAAPEPSAYALGLVAIALFFVLRRRSMLV